MQNSFSVLISLYNKEHESSLNAALLSVANQTFKPGQVVIVLDGPLRESLLAVVNSYMNKLDDLTIVPIEQNVGLGRALNYGLEYCKYELVARMDTDDICYPERFEKQLTHMFNHKEISVLGCTVQEFNIEPYDTGIYRRLPLKLSDIMNFAKFRNPLNHPSVVFRKSDVLAAGSYMDMPLFEDFYLWVRMLRKGFVIENIEEPLLHFRTGNDMVGRRHGYSYLKKEIQFHSVIRKMGFINNLRFISLIVTKTPLRLIPKSVLKFVYKKFLR